MILAAAAQAIGRNVMRSALTMLGVFIGVAALIVMVAVGQGANDAVRKQIENLGTNVVVILPGAVVTGGVRGGFGSASTLTVDDAHAIAREDPAVAQVGYLILQHGQTHYSNQNWTTTSRACRQLSAGHQLANRGGPRTDPGRREQADLVVVLGQTVYRQLFSEGENPLGATILVSKDVPLRVVGVLAAKGQTHSARTRTIS